MNSKCAALEVLFPAIRRYSPHGCFIGISVHSLSILRGLERGNYHKSV